MDPSIRRRIANHDLTYEEAEELEWQKQEATLDRDLVGVPGTGSPTGQVPAHVNTIQSSRLLSEAYRRGTTFLNTKKMTCLRSTPSISPESPQVSVPFKEES